MKILVFASFYAPFVGGAEVACQQVFERLADEHEIHVVTGRHNENVALSEVINGVHVHRVGKGNEKDKLHFILHGSLFAKKLHKKIGFDISYVLMANQAGLAAMIFNRLTRRRVPSILNLQNGMSIEHVKKQVPTGFWWLYKRLYTEFSQVTVIGSSLMQRAKEFGVRDPVLIPNGVDTSLFIEEAYDEQLAKKLGILKEHKVIITTSRLSYKNNIEGLIDAMKHLGDEYRLLIVGDGELAGALKGIAKEDKRIIFTGNIDYKNLPSYLSLADVFVRASHTESFGNSFIEAMACGVPIIGTRVGGIPDFLTDGRTGLFTETSGERIASTVVRLMDDNILYESIKKNGLALAQTYSWDVIAPQVKTVIEQVARKKILLVTGIYPPAIGGPATYVKMLEKELPLRGYDVHILTLGEMPHTDLVSYIPRTKGFFARSLAIKRFIERGNYDIVYAQTPFSVGFGVALSWGKAKKILKVVGDNVWEISQDVLGVRDSIDDFQKKTYSFKINVMKMIEHWSAKRFDTVITPSKYLQGIVLGWGVKKEKSVVVYNAVKRPEINESKEELRKEFGIDGKTYLTVARITPWKGIDTLIDVFSERKEHLIVIGDGPLFDEMKEKAKGFDNITLLGRLPKDSVYRYMKACDGFLLNSSYEGLPHVVIEALYLDCPVAASKAGGTPEIVIPGKTGTLFTYNNKKSIVKGIEKMKHHDFTMKQFDQTVMLDHLCEVFA